jgi:hypothetical protein
LLFASINSAEEKFQVASNHLPPSAYPRADTTLKFQVWMDRTIAVIMASIFLEASDYLVYEERKGFREYQLSG